MSINNYLLIAGILLLNPSCKKEPQYSTWYVNGQKFTTNDVRKEEGKAVHNIVANDLQNRFYLEFHLSGFPTMGTYPIRCSQQNPDWCCLTILFNGMDYINAKNGTVQCSINNKKAQYTMQPTWFYKYKYPDDSILVSGTFNEP